MLQVLAEAKGFRSARDQQVRLPVLQAQASVLIVQIAEEFAVGACVGHLFWRTRRALAREHEASERPRCRNDARYRHPSSDGLECTAERGPSKFWVGSSLLDPGDPTVNHSSGGSIGLRFESCLECDQALGESAEPQPRLADPAVKPRVDPYPS